jgi:hypothetical protein
MRTQHVFSTKNRRLRRGALAKRHKTAPLSISPPGQEAALGDIAGAAPTLKRAQEVLRLAQQERRIARQEREFAEYCLKEVQNETMWLAQNFRTRIKYL